MLGFVVTDYNDRKLNYYMGVMSHGCSQSDMVLGVVGMSMTVHCRLEIAYIYVDWYYVYGVHIILVVPCENLST